MAVAMEAMEAMAVVTVVTAVDTTDEAWVMAVAVSEAGLWCKGALRV